MYSHDIKQFNSILLKNFTYIDICFDKNELMRQNMNFEGRSLSFIKEHIRNTFYYVAAVEADGKDKGRSRRYITH